MIFHRQTGKRNCGQIAVASLTDNPVETIERLVGHSHGTKTKELAKVLRDFGWYSSGRCKPIRFLPEWPKYALAQIHADDRAGWHWIAIGDGKVYDGHYKEPFSLVEYVNGLRGFSGRPKLTSILPLIRL